MGNTLQRSCSNTHPVGCYSYTLGYTLMGVNPNYNPNSPNSVTITPNVLQCIYRAFGLTYCTMHIYTVRDTENLPYSADTPRRFSEGCCTDTRMPVWQCADHQRGNVRTFRRSRRSPRMNAQAYTLDRKRVLAAEAVSLQSHCR